MGTQVFLAVACCLATSEVFANNVNVNVKDSVSEASVSQLYHKSPFGVYATSAPYTPYAAYSFQVPTYLATPTAEGTKVVPIKQDTIVIRGGNGYLQDSYGNKFGHTPQALAYPNMFPQQYVALQGLPKHLAQPLLASSSLNVKQATPNFYFGQNFKRPSLQAATPTPLINFAAHSNPLVYAENLRNFAPSTHQHFGFPSKVRSPQQQSTKNKEVYVQSREAEYFRKPQPNEPKFARLEDNPQHSHHQGEHHREHNSDHHSGHRQQEYRDIDPDHNARHQQTREHSEEHHHNREHDHHKNNHHQKEHSHSGHNKQHNREQSSGELNHNNGQASRAANNHATNNHAANNHAAPAKLTSITTVDHQGKKTVVNIETQPPVPLLDINLLQPLHFKNPIVPQVQHFLPSYPRIYPHLTDASHAQKKKEQEFVITSSKSYDTGVILPELLDEAPKNNHKQPAKEEKPPATHEFKIITNTNSNPEFSYEIKSPNYKETYNEQVVSYNKKTEPEPVVYTYEKQTVNEPVHYSYAHHSEQPMKVTHVEYGGEGKAPKELVYHFKPEELKKEQESPPPQHESEDSNESSEDTEDEGPPQHASQREQSSQEEEPSNQYKKPADDGKKNYVQSYEITYDSPPQHYSQESHHNSKPEHRQVENYQAQPVAQTGAADNPWTPFVLHSEFQPIIPEYHEDIRLLPAHRPNADIKVDPNQHAQISQHKSNSASAPEIRAEQEEVYHPPAPRIQEKSKKIIIQEETPEEMHSHAEQMLAEMIDHEENSEEDFEKSYKDAAYGFPTYDRAQEDAEKDIYNPESYGVSKDHQTYDIENTPFQQYQQAGDDFPKSSRLQYKDNKDSTKEDYYLDYSISKPEGMLDNLKSKAEYYKMFKKQKPKFLQDEDEKDSNKQKLNAKYTAAPSFEYDSEPKSYFAKYKKAPPKFEYNYPKKATPKDNSAFASKPYQRYKLKTNFVEPQFQYGFEPISIPRLLDSELAAMASNDSPESEKPGSRKKIYKENFYIKKTSTSSRKPAS